jgi:hypothetical protein
VNALQLQDDSEELRRHRQNKVIDAEERQIQP